MVLAADYYKGSRGGIGPSSQRSALHLLASSAPSIAPSQVKDTRHELDTKDTKIQDT
jgi:hypothetical protein